jgi:hypothetical protein
MEGFSGERPWSDVVNDDLIPLLNHSDCDGELSPDECSKIAPRLRAVVAPWPEDYDKINALKLADGMEWCVDNQQPLIFT